MLRPPRAMVVDDEMDHAHLFTRMLNGSGFDCVSFTDPPLALDHIRQNLDRYSLVLTDYKMPHFDGLQLAKKIRDHNSTILIFLLTAENIDKILLIKDIDDVKISRVLQKPIRKAILMRYIQEFQII